MSQFVIEKQLFEATPCSKWWKPSRTHLPRTLHSKSIDAMKDALRSSAANTLHATDLPRRHRPIIRIQNRNNM
jgi:hypothetical protein